MADWLLALYFRYTLKSFCLLSSISLKFLMKPSSLSILAIATYIFDDGISTFRCPAFTALRILVSISEMGSETLLIIPLLHSIDFLP